MIPTLEQSKPTESTKAERAEFFREWMASVVKAAKEASEKHGYVRILDIATGGNGTNVDIIRELVSNNIRYQFTLSDISPVIFKKGYETLMKRVPEEVKNVTFVLADSTDLRKDIEKVIIWRNWRKKHLKEVLRMPEYSFLNTGYANGHRLVNFQDESFDIITGLSAYTNIMPTGPTGTFMPAIKESHRVLRKGGYHIVYDGQTEVINTSQPRTHGAMEYAKIRTLDILIDELNQVFGSEPEKVLPIFRYYDNKGESEDQATQFGDYLKKSVVVHRKK
jgi:ubiquinone/menaquinone biosynthesis C-methylase UbiE